MTDPSNIHEQAPLVSIILAAKDTAPYIADCLRSIQAQTYTNWELLAVNDHSTDGTDEIIASFAAKDARIKHLQSEGELLIPALQTGYKHAKGILINRMDSDDKMPADKLEVMVNAWLQQGRGWIIAGGTEHFVDEGEVGEGFRKYEDWLNEVARTHSHWQHIYRECVIPSHCWMLHRDDFEQAGAFDSPIYPEDYDLCFRFYAQGFQVYGLDKVLHYWRDRSDRISRTWDVYQDNRYYELKWKNFAKLDRDAARPLVLWGAGRNGKDLAKLLLENNEQFTWICDNPKKIGLDIYDVRMEAPDALLELKAQRPQVIVAVASPDGLNEIEQSMAEMGFGFAEDYWCF